MPRISVAFVVIGIVLSGSACANRPTAADLTNSILTSTEADPTVNLTPDQASCIAQRLLDTDLSDTTLAGLADDFDNPEVLSAELNRVEPAVEAAAATCVGG